ncbi:hypothetical protein ATANTOWER_008744 [Ataeniobius toweri]|uniref:Uncharacterized protein n=1 Tax=Ataeniobius toweri TaxID=208326 RepID=A0ABU7AEU9_9TELE|nr:hypothetical protein [Ataeniobius toweri]
MPIIAYHAEERSPSAGQVLICLPIGCLVRLLSRGCQTKPIAAFRAWPRKHPCHSAIMLAEAVILQFVRLAASVE